MSDNADALLRRQIGGAIAESNVEAVRDLLVQHPHLLHQKGGLGATWLHDAAAFGSVNVVEALLALGIDVNAGVSQTPLGSCIHRGYLDVARALLDVGGSPNAGRLLIDAINAKQNNLELVKLLVEHGADVNRCWRFGDEEKGPLFNALSWAMNKGRTDIADYLRAHGAVMPDAHVPQAKATAADEVIAFFQKRFGEVDREALSEIVPTSEYPVAIHRIGPSGSRNSQLLFTTGMSDESMRAPANGQEYRFAELLIELPSDWPLSQQAFTNANHRWPIDWLRKVAAYPRQEKTWLGGPFAIMSNGEPPAPFAPGCGFTAMLLLSGYDDVGPIKLQSGKLVQLYTLIPLYTEEKELEQREDLPELFRRLDGFGVGRLVNISRPNVAARTDGVDGKRRLK
jgi:hypothetical protein